MGDQSPPPEPIKLRWGRLRQTSLAGYWLLTVTVVPSNLVMLMLNGSA